MWLETSVAHLWLGEHEDQLAVSRAGAQTLERCDHVVFEAEEIRNGAGDPYSVFTPYRNAWWRRWHDAPRLPVAATRLPPPIPGFTADAIPAPASTSTARVVTSIVPSRSPIASEALVIRFITTWRIWVTSPSMGGAFLASV